MAHFAVVCPEEAGHLLSVGTLGAELARHGHQVTLVAGSTAAPLAQKLNLPLYPLSVDDVPRPSPGLRHGVFGLAGQRWAGHWQDHYGWRAEVLLRRLPTALRELRVDGLVTDQILLAAGTVAEHLNVPSVTVCSAVPWNQEDGVPPNYTHWDYATGDRARLRNRLGYTAWNWLLRPVLKAINRYRLTWHLPPLKHVDQTYSPLAQLSQLCPDMDFPRPGLPDVFHYVGPLGTSRPADDSEFRWDRLDGRPLIFASLGTVPHHQNLPILRQIALACADLDAQLVMALGKWADADDVDTRDQLGPVPGDPILVDFAPQLALLDRATLLITHAGINTVMEAIARGVPMVALPRCDDQPGMAARVLYAGVGLRGSFTKIRSKQLRGLIQRVLSEESFRDRARQLQQAMANTGGVQRAAEITERALLTGQPVYRDRGS